MSPAGRFGVGPGTAELVVAAVSELDGAQPAAAITPTRATLAPIRVNTVRRVCWEIIDMLLFRRCAANPVVAVMFQLGFGVTSLPHPLR
jgi:hypothetical protein